MPSQMITSQEIDRIVETTDCHLRVCCRETRIVRGYEVIIGSWHCKGTEQCDEKKICDERGHDRRHDGRLKSKALQHELQKLHPSN